MSPLTITRVAHACVLLEVGGVRVLTDPWLSEKPGYHQGEQRAFATAADLPRLDGIVVSHGHYDHFDLAGLEAYPDKSIPMVVKRGLGARAARAGWSDVTEVDPWQAASIGPLTLTATPARHQVPEVTYVLEGGGRRVFFGADTLRMPEHATLRDRFGPFDVALLPVNGLTIKPLRKQIVMDAHQAAALTAALRPRIAVPIHYAFTAGPVRERLLLKLDRSPEHYVQAAARVAPGSDVRVLDPGQPLTV